ncbi:Gfo/Idh/MocA family protein [[Clostridium] fimetarium]|uniref:Predicted dehydrogenase n=1 Tax=[Clostridium] fimetarium TaxID=99656 RepID=A0A1I0RCS5_9FIRM|nr:Gfo/Idh/MocA family oxidoreductase [[Clostridium] fimetarium]SEW38038.1 Predicted dehydrogenase [[Clostridium] fimetarium]
MSENNIVRMAIIGVGNMGMKYATMINDGKVKRMVLTAVCARSEDSKKWVRENLNDGVQIFSSSDELFSNGDLYDAVLITTPHKSHPQLAIEAFELGKHVFCEKPAGVSLIDAKKMEVAAYKAGKKYAMMFHLRTYPVIKKLKQLLQENTIGTIDRMILENSIYYRTKFYHESGSWRSSWAGEGGGALINQGQHILDYWQWMFGMPEAIIADIPFGKYNDFEVDDEATLLMEYPNKKSAVFILTTGEIQREEKLSIIGSKGKISMYGNKIEVERNEADAVEYGMTAKINTRDNMKTTSETIICDAPSEPYEIILNNFSEAVLDGTDLIASGKDGSNTLEISNAAYMSAWLNQKITFPIDAFVYDKMLQEHIALEKGSI